MLEVAEEPGQVDAGVGEQQCLTLISPAVRASDIVKLFGKGGDQARTIIDESSK